jgi:hypothetical protein
MHLTGNVMITLCYPTSCYFYHARYLQMHVFNLKLGDDSSKVPGHMPWMAGKESMSHMLWVRRRMQGRA